MIPFDLNGPNFLVFYAVCGAVACLVLYLLQLQRRSHKGQSYDITLLRRASHPPAVAA